MKIFTAFKYVEMKKLTEKICCVEEYAFLSSLLHKVEELQVRASQIVFGAIDVRSLLRLHL